MTVLERMPADTEATRVSARAPRSGGVPITIELPRGGIFPEPCDEPSAPRRHRDVVLAAICPLLQGATHTVPDARSVRICDAAIARVRSEIAAAVAAFRGRLGAFARTLEPDARVSVEDLALMLHPSEDEMLEAVLPSLAPEHLVSLSVAGLAQAARRIDRTVRERVAFHMLSLVRHACGIDAATRARVLAASGKLA